MEPYRIIDQPQLLPEADHHRASEAQPIDRRRQAGLLGIARARAALAQAAQHAQDRSASKAA